MIDFENLNSYKENNRIEAKKAQGGLPQSIWETYSSFANTMGGIILLGVEELSDKALNPVLLDNPYWLADEFWDKLNDPVKANKNILRESDISIEKVNGMDIVAIRVPKAGRYDKPIYVDNNIKNTFKRNGEGDYRCTSEEIKEMQRSSSILTGDMVLFPDLNREALKEESINKFRRRMENCCPGHVWEELDNDDFLFQIGAVGKGDGNRFCPNAAGLLMFGKKEAILEKFPKYSLDYIEVRENGTREKRISALSDTWSGNLYDFYFMVKKRLLKTLSVPLVEAKGSKKEDMAVYDAVFEALSNSLINADYFWGGTEIVNFGSKVEISNAGVFAIDLEKAKAGGFSEPRNLGLMKMFSQVDISDSVGGGIPHIFKIWNIRGWEMPQICESFSPDKITVSLAIGKKEKLRDRLKRNNRTLSKLHREMIIDYLTDNSKAGLRNIAYDLNLSISGTQNALDKLCDDDIVVCRGKKGSKIYELKA